MNKSSVNLIFTQNMLLRELIVSLYYAIFSPRNTLAKGEASAAMESRLSDFQIVTYLRHLVNHLVP